MWWRSVDDWDDIPERDFYSDFEELLDEERMPVSVDLGNGQAYVVAYEVADWSPLYDEDPERRVYFICQAIIHTAHEAFEKGLYGTSS